MKLGKKQILTVIKKVEFGAYLGTEEEQVLLPKKQVPADIEPGDPIEVFLYKDSKDRLIATTNEPKLVLGSAALLTVKEVGKIGAFLDWGLEKDLLLPFREQTTKVSAGDTCMAALYVDKSDRLCATMKVYDYLEKESPYKKDDHVKGLIYELSDQFGVFVAVDNKYSALIPMKEAYGNLKIGMEIEARVTDVKADGKLDLSIREKTPFQMDRDAKTLMDLLKENNGEIPYTDKSDPEVIKEKLGMSKNAFKRAVGRLLKNQDIELKEKSIAIRRK